jgi:hypothetical protein
MRAFHLTICAVAFVVALSARASSQAAPPLAPAVARAAGLSITGFRSARFGMTPAQVKTAITADFGTASVAAVTNPAEGTTGLLVTLPHLDPGPGTAQVTYLFGANAKTLSHVNVVWLIGGNPGPAERADMLAAAAQLTSYFTTRPQRPRQVSGVHPVGPNSLSMYAAVDKDGAAVDVLVAGVAFQAATPGAAPAVPPQPVGPALLRISYSANAANPDILRAPPRPATGRTVR